MRTPTRRRGRTPLCSPATHRPLGPDGRIRSTASPRWPATAPDRPPAGRARRDRLGPAERRAVIVKRIPSPVVAVRGVCVTGGVYEGQWLGGGLSHLLEHLVAGGSNGRRTEAENRNLLQQIGNDSNAYTTEDHTAYFVNTTTPHMEQAVDLVTGWMYGEDHAVPEYRREYQVVQRELEKGKGQPDRFLGPVPYQPLPRQPARVPVIGYQEVIQGLAATTSTAITRSPTSRTTWCSRSWATSTRRRCSRRCSAPRGREARPRLPQTSPPSPPCSPRGPSSPRSPSSARPASTCRSRP